MSTERLGSLGLKWNAPNSDLDLLRSGYPVGLEVTRVDAAGHWTVGRVRFGRRVQRAAGRFGFRFRIRMG